MADKSVGELIAAQSVTPTDLFVLEQNGTAKKLTGQVLENWLVSFADGHGGIQSIAKLSTSGLADTYRITMADTTTFDFVVNNGRGITGISKTSTSGLVDTYTISYNDGTSGTLAVKNGEKGDKGDNAYIWIKYASQEPTESSHSMGDIPDDWIGIYSGGSSTAPTDWKQYKWFQIKGEKGDTGTPATLVTKSVTYQVSDSGTIIPSGAWGNSIPVVPQGKYLWTKTELQFNSGDPIVSYSVARMGIDGSGAVSSVAGVSPDATGNVTLTAADVGALAVSGGDMTGAINMNGQSISGLNDPTEDNHAARKSYVDKMLPKTGGAMTGSIAMGGNRITNLGTPTANSDAATKGYADAAAGKAAIRNLLDNSDFTNLVAQAGIGGNHGTVAYAADRWILDSGTVTGEANENGNGYRNITLNGTIRQIIANPPAVGTAGVEMISGTAAVSYTNGELTITSSGGIIKNVLLCAAETLPEYQPKGYAAELAECLRYYYRLSNNEVYGVQNPASLYNATTVRVTFTLPVEMRVNPTVSILSGAVGEWNVFTIDKLVHPTAYTVLYQLKNRAVNFVLTIPSKTTQTPAVVCITSSIDFSADL